MSLHARGVGSLRLVEMLLACCLFECNFLMDFCRFERKEVKWSRIVSHRFLSLLPLSIRSFKKLGLGSSFVEFCRKKILKSKCVISNAESWWQMSLSPHCCVRSADSRRLESRAMLVVWTLQHRGSGLATKLYCCHKLRD